MSGFAALMALSASQTKEAQSAVQTALEQRQRNEAHKRKKQEELERKTREEEAKLRRKRFEDEKRQQEQEAKRASEEARRVTEQTRREEEARNALLYGPKKAKQLGPKWPTSQSGLKEEVRRQRSMGELVDKDDDEASVAMVLTREEKRQRRMEAEMRRTYQLKRSSSGFLGKAGRRLRGGAIDAPASAGASDTGASTQSVKARLAALPNTLTKLNVNKRDTRTIDEILQDRAKAKNTTLDGDDAREFNDWFGTAKKKDSVSVPATQSSEGLGMSTPSSSANSPRPGTRPASQPPAKLQTPTANGNTVSNPVGGKLSSQSKSALSTKTSSSVTLKPSSATKSSRSRSPVPKSHATKSGSSFVSGGAPFRSGGGAPLKKRPRSPSLSLSPAPKRRASEPENSISSEIWKLFGKDRSSYVARDVLSDDEDMEADAGALMKEEMQSSRLAKREDEMALEDEKRHEDEKRRRKRDREIRERQGM